MKTFYVLPLLTAAGLFAAPEASALTLDNGRSLNGRNLNGLSFNGTVRDSEVAGHATTVILKDGARVLLK